MIRVNMRLSRTRAFGRHGESGPPGANQGGAPAPPGSPGGPPPGLFGGANSGLRYNLTLSVMANNVINHPNYAAPSGDLSSLYFGESRTLAGNFGPGGGSSAYNRRIMLQLRFSF